VEAEVPAVGEVVVVVPTVDEVGVEGTIGGCKEAQST
jgi:hypothetical protein